MPITGEYPEAGVRIEIERLREDAPPWIYRGHAVTPGARWPMSAVVSDAGEVTVSLGADAPTGTAERVRLMLRAAWKHAQSEGRGAPPRRLVRWRDER
jgi:hypothetical protein